MTAKRIHYISLGCPKNRVDTEVMVGVGTHEGYQVEPDPAQAEVIVVNTCGFIDAAKQESIDTILDMSRMKETGKCQTLVVAGCLSQRYGAELAREMPEVDYFLGSSDMLKLGEILARQDARSQAQSQKLWVGNPADYVYRASDPRVLSQNSFSAYVKIAEGCNRSCSFCAIPSFRGKQRSRHAQDISREVTALAAQGVREVNLISQDTMSYGRDLHGKPTLSALVRALGDIDQVKWIRLFYLYPEKLTDDLIELLAHHPKVLPYIDMPLQHASDPMLRRMRRGHGGKRLYQVVETLRARVANATWRTAFIVGHPGETEQDFQELYEFARWAQFDRMGVFLYSSEDGTRSATMPDAVPRAVARARQRKLLSLQRRISKAKNRALVGQTVEVLVEGISDESEFLLQGRHRGQAPEIDGHVILANGEAQPGEIRQALVQAASEYDLVADLLSREGTLDRPPPGLGASGAAPARKPRTALRVVS
jgi:ribosomal protein S12 methylthiotransferase